MPSSTLAMSRELDLFPEWLKQYNQTFTFTGIIIAKERMFTRKNTVYLKVLVLIPEPTEEQRNCPSFFPVRGSHRLTPSGVFEDIHLSAVDFAKNAFLPHLDDGVIRYLWISAVDNQIAPGHPILCWISVFGASAVAALQLYRPLDVVTFNQVIITTTPINHFFWSITGGPNAPVLFQLHPEQSAVGECAFFSLFAC